MTHLNALQTRLANERARLASSKTDQERAMRSVWVAQCEKEIARETSREWSDSASGQSAARYFDAIEVDEMSDRRIACSSGRLKR
jgi:hypothetical protein